MDLIDVVIAKGLNGNGGDGKDIRIKRLNVTENGSYSEENVAYSPVNVNVPIPENAYFLKKVKGEIATFTDGSEMPMPKVECEINPMQDLHGYAHSWVGGAGKNKFEPLASGGSSSNVSFVRNDDYSLTFTGKSNGTTRTPNLGQITLKAGTYILSGVTGGSSNTYGMRVSKSVDSSLTELTIIYDGESTFTLEEDADVRVTGRFSNVYTDNYNVKFYPMIRLASETDSTFEPYENICPIEGFTECNVQNNPNASDKIFGLNVNFEERTYTRLDDAIGKSAGTDFDELYCYGGRKRCNVADDGTILAYYGDANFMEDGSNGQVMVYQPKFYYKVEPLKIDSQSTGIGYHLRNANYYIADYKAKGFKLHPAFIDKKGREVDYLLIGAYEASLYDSSAGDYVKDDSQVMNLSEDKLSSIAYVKPASGSTQQFTRPNIETLAQNRGTNWHGSTIKIASMNQLLCMIEMGTMNFQTAIGQGVVSYESGDGNEASNTGATVSLGNGTGQATQTVHVSSTGVQTTDTIEGKLSVSYRGLENPWGNIWEFECGVNIWGNGNMAGGEPYIASDFNFAESKNDDNYEGAGFAITNANNYISAIGYSTRCDWLFMASECEGSTQLPVGDYIYVSSNMNTYRIARLGGRWADGARAGGFYWALNSGVDAFLQSVGGRLVYVPTTTDSTYKETTKKVNIAFQDEDNPLTVYGGSLDVTSGKLVVDRAMVDMGTLNWSIYDASKGSYVARFADMKDYTLNAICSQYTVVADYTEWLASDGTFYKDPNGKLHIKDSQYANVSATNFKIAMNGVQLVYELTEPQTYQLTPIQINSLLGTNNICHDCNGEVEVEYFAK